ncbi:MAG: cbb3-type cytochrome oxidase assembly protein CcoS [Chitinophagaceae bacterium]|nr:cbb3-type cytochrome oxidase assembly protein CcoS [Chitinophagaceae bacterium]
MSVMLLLLGASLTVSLIFVAAFIWSVKDGQYDDDYGPAHQIFFEDTKPKQS